MPFFRSLVIAAALFSAPAPGEYTPPVEGVPIDAFRAPASPYAAGNRGVDYATDPGQPVLAAAEGEVVFAGRVGHGQHVVVLHPDGVRTSYSFLAAVGVRRGDRVERGAPVGTAGTRVHIGARIGEAYVDPLRLFSGRPVRRAHLVADDDTHKRVDERAALTRLLRSLRPSHADEEQWRRDQHGCTPPDEALPPPPRGRIVVLVGGLGSATGAAAILSVDTAALGYAPADVHQFSYRPDGAPYSPADTQQDIFESGRLLARHLRRLHDQHPGSAIDVFAHSQGGLVVRAALASDGGLEGIATVVTLGTPHEGNALAAAAQRLDRSSRSAAVAFDLAGDLGIGGIDPTSTSVRQLAVGSEFLRRLPPTAPARDRTHFLAIAAATDAVVPAARARWLGARSMTLDLTGSPTATDHARLPGDPAVTKELGLALLRRGPTCVDLATWQRRRVAGMAVERAQQHLASGLGGVAGWVDRQTSAGGHRVVRR